MSSCRAAALEAHARKDFEAFHDLAWLAYRKGSQDDAELMLLLARAQSLSGRPNDAIVMLQRIAAARGIPTDAATSEDFARVRALPRWKELFGDSSSPTPGAGSPAAPRAPGAAPATSADARTRADAPTSAGATSGKPTDKPGTASSPSIPKGRRAPGAALTFTTLLKPSALAYDAVSKRYLVADRGARRVAVVDENSGQVSTFLGSQTSLGDIGGIAIDPQEGDLWVVSDVSGDTILHRLQLISGRVLHKVPLAGVKAPLVGLTFVRGVGLIGADSSGNIWRVSARGHLEHLGDVEYAPRGIASDAAGRVYLSPGGPGLARLSVVPRVGPREVVRLPDEAVVDGGITIAGERLHFLAQRNGGFEIRTMPIRK